MKLSTKNQRLEAIENALIVSVDIGSKTHYARVYNHRGFEFSSKAKSFDNNSSGFMEFENWIEAHRSAQGLKTVVVGLEPTGHYWFPLRDYLKNAGYLLGLTSPVSVKKMKEMASNPSKSDTSDPHAIAKVIIQGDYMAMQRPTGNTAELREICAVHNRIVEDQKRTVNRIHRFLSIYFPEWREAYSCVRSKSLLIVLKQAPLPQDIVQLGVNGIVKLWRDSNMRSMGHSRAHRLVEQARQSIGVQTAADSARFSLRQLLEDYDRQATQIVEAEKIQQRLLAQFPEADLLMQIPGIGLQIAANILGSIGDIKRFPTAKQLQSYVGLDIVVNTSGIYKGVSRISKRGPGNARKALYLAANQVIMNTPEFREIRDYYQRRRKNPLKPKQAIICVACKLLRVIWVMLTTGQAYDPKKLIADIVRPDDERLPVHELA